MYFLLSGIALAAEPDLEGPRVAVGADLLEHWGTTVSIGAIPRAGLRLHAGRRCLFEVAGSAGRVTRADEDERTETDSGETSDLDFSGADLSGWSASGSARLTGRIGGKGPIAWYAGVFGVLALESLEGPILEDVPDPDTDDVNVEEVGRAESRSRELSAGPSLQAVHWLTPRVSLSALIEVSAYNASFSEEREEYDDGAVDRREDDDRAIGLTPRVGLGVYLLL